MAVVATAAAGLRAIENGATIVQLRAPRLTARDLERECHDLVRACTVPVVLSSRCDVALACGAAGVNLPERDVSVAEARSVLGDHIVGRSVHSLEAAIAAADQGADYVLFGPVWASPTHPDQGPSGLDALRSVVRAVHVPVLAIGGVDRGRARECIDAGAAGYAAIRMFA